MANRSALVVNAGKIEPSAPGASINTSLVQSPAGNFSLKAANTVGVNHSANWSYFPVVDGAANDVLIGTSNGIYGWTPVPRLIRTNTTYYVSPTGNDSTGDGSSGSPWLTITKVFASINDALIANGAIITISLASGTHTFAGPMQLKHRDMNYIKIEGAAPTTISITNMAASSGTAGNRTYTFNVNTTTGVNANDYCTIHSASGGNNPDYTVGCFKISAVNSGNGTIAVNNRNLTAAAPNGAITATCVVHKTVLSCNTNTAFFYFTANQLLKLLSNAVLVGTGPANGALGIKADQYSGVILGQNVAFYNFGVGVHVTQHSLVDAPLVTGFGECQTAVFTDTFGTFTSENSHISCNEYGLRAGNRGVIYANDSITAGANVHGALAENDGLVAIPNSNVTGCVLAGGKAMSGGCICGAGKASIRNASHGFLVTMGGILCDTVNASYNTANGVHSIFNSTCIIRSSVMNNNVWGIYAANNSYCDTLSSTFSGNSSGTRSPTANTTGNTEAYIYG